MPIVAEQGLATSLDEIATRADVTRNLLYHYFPRGRQDILLAVGERAGHQLTDDWAGDEAIPLEQRLAANFMRFMEHAMEPTDAWRIHRHGRVSHDPEHQAMVDRFEAILVSGVSLNNFGTPDPPPTTRLAIKGFIAFSETVLDEARETGAPREQVLSMVAQTLATGLQTAASASA
jgi:AcrR family transcriptional regulator